MTLSRSGRERIGVAGECLAAVPGHQEQVFEPHFADLGYPQAGLDGDHVAGDQDVIAHQPQRGSLVDGQANAVAEAELESLAGVLAWAGPLSAVPRGLENLAGHLV